MPFWVQPWVNFIGERRGCFAVANNINQSHELLPAVRRLQTVIVPASVVGRITRIGILVGLQISFASRLVRVEDHSLAIGNCSHDRKR
jgi:hypothetical protein